ncbi:MAG TPA: TolC family protein [Steroidobacteraceae bacterium]|nr:TolC family protein [Steroidobacteraceae bacterium]
MNARPERSAGVILACAAVMSWPGAARGESLEDAWAVAAARDQGYAAVQSDVTAAREQLDAARAQRNPTLALDGAFTQLEDSPAFDFSSTGLPVQLPEIFDNDNFANAGVTLSLPLYTGGRISNGIEAASAQLEAREALGDGALQDLRIAVARAYVDVLLARSRNSVAESSVATLAAYTDEVRAMFAREMVPSNDLLAAEVALADARQNLLRAENAVELAASAYNRLLGRPFETPVELDPELPAAATELLALPQSALAERALEARPELLALEAQARALGAQAESERALLKPQLGLRGGYLYFENQALDRETFATASIGFEWAIFDGGQIRARAASLRAAQQAAGHRADDLRSRIELGVRQASLALSEARARVEVTRDAVEQAEENLRITRQQYNAGLSTSTRVLEAETLRVRALLNRDQAVFDADLAALELARAVGAL